MARSLLHMVGMAVALAALALPSRAQAACPQLLMNNEFTDSFIGPWAIDATSPELIRSVMITNDQYKTLDVEVLNISGVAGQTAQLSQSVAIKYGERYRVSFYMYTSQAMTARVAIHSATDSGKTYGLNDSFQTSNNFNSATQSFTFVAPEGDPDAVFSIYFPIPTYALYRFDSLFVEDISAPECTGGAGGSSGSGGAPGSGGATSTGGAPGAGGAPGTGGATGSGGRAASGGAPGTGGRVGSGGSAMGGATNSGGRSGGGGLTGSGGMAATGGASGTGNATGSTGGDSGTMDAGSLPGSGGATGSGGDTGGGTTCVPGQQIACACVGSTTAHGVQMCNAQGTGYATCTGCPDAGTTPARGPSSMGCGCALSSPDANQAPWWVGLLLLGFIRRRAPASRR